MSKWRKRNRPGISGTSVTPTPTGLGYVTVATTRPETMLGDSAVAVNPKDERYDGQSGQDDRPAA